MADDPGATKRKTSGEKRAGGKRATGRARGVERYNRNGLTDSEQVFIDAYLADPSRNQTNAYLSTHPKSSRGAAGNNASRIMQRPRVQAHLAVELDRAQRRNEMTRDRLLAELAEIALLDPAELMTDDGNIRNLSEMPAGARRSIQSVEVHVTYEDGTLSTAETRTDIKKLKIADKLRAIETAGRMMGLFAADNRQRIGAPPQFVINGLGPVAPGGDDE